MTTVFIVAVCGFLIIDVVVKAMVIALIRNGVSVQYKVGGLAGDVAINAVFVVAGVILLATGGAK